MVGLRKSARSQRRPFAAGSLAAILTTLLLLPASGQVATGLATTWQGHYFYGPRLQSVPFVLRITSFKNGSFTGRTSEPYSGFGTLPCSQLFGNVQGQVTGNAISFVKTYDGTCGVTHSVAYSGTMPNERTMEGTWHTTISGTFTATASE
jgi:hypothetical protein